MITRLASTLGLLFLLALGFSQESDLEHYFDSFLEIKEFRHAAISAYVQELSTDEVLLDHNGSMTLVPASTQKIITTYAAFAILGEDYQYTTRITYDGKISSDGTLDGNVYIEGSGDPTLGSTKIDGGPTFYQVLGVIVDFIKAEGITCIAGKIVADESVFDSYPISPSWQWNDLGNYYASGAWGINIHDNQYYITLKQTPKEGGYPELLHYSPYIPNLEIDNEVTTGKIGTGDEAYIFGGPYDYKKRIVGTIPPGTSKFTIKGSIPDPPMFMGYALHKQLKKTKISCEGYTSIWKKDQGKSRRKELGVILSPPLKDIIKLANFQSNNLFCEAILKTIGLHRYKKGAGQYGIRAIKDFCKKNKISTSAIFLEDGSGLSFRNRISSQSLSEFIKTTCALMGTQEFSRFLPKMGMQGTIRGMLAGKSSRGHVWAKSGSMNGVISYAGILKNKSGKWLSFSIIINGFEEKYKEVRPHLENFIHNLYNT